MWLFPPGLSLMALRVVFILQSGWQWLQYSVQWEGQVYISHYTCHHDPPLSQTFPSSVSSHSVLWYSQLSSNKSRIPQTSNNLILFFAQRTWRYYSIKLLISGCRLYRDCFITSLCTEYSGDGERAMGSLLSVRRCPCPQTELNSILHSSQFFKMSAGSQVVAKKEAQNGNYNLWGGRIQGVRVGRRTLLQFWLFQYSSPITCPRSDRKLSRLELIIHTWTIWAIVCYLNIFLTGRIQGFSRIRKLNSRQEPWMTIEMKRK